MKNAPFHHDGSLPQYVLEPNANEIYFPFPLVTQVQGEETSSGAAEVCFLFIFLVSKFWINVNQQIANLVEFTLEK
jgi:hypothetical protein